MPSSGKSVPQYSSATSSRTAPADPPTWNSPESWCAMYGIAFTSTAF